MNDDELDERVRQAARAYNAPPETPREAMWARIEAARRAGDQPAPVERRSPRRSCRCSGPGPAPRSGRRPRRRSWWSASGSAACRSPVARRPRAGRVPPPTRRRTGSRPRSTWASRRRSSRCSALRCRSGTTPGSPRERLASSSPPTGCCSTPPRRPTRRPGCCWKTWSWCWRRSPSSRRSRGRRTCGSFVKASSGAM